MTTHLVLIHLVFTVILPRSTLGATYIMIQVPGFPDPATSYPSDILENSPFEDCVQKCFSDDYCVVVYWSNNNKCLYYVGGDVIKVRNDAELSASEDKVAFKISATSCTATAPEVLNGVSTPYQYSNINAYKISIASDFYTIQYTYTAMDACGNWYMPTPQCSVCKHTMFSFRGNMFTGNDTQPSTTQVKSWMDCLSSCYTSDECFIARMRESGKCYLFNYGSITGILKKDPTTMPLSSDSLNYVAMKYIPEATTCSLSFDELFNGHTLLTTSITYPSFELAPESTNTTVEWTKREGCGDGDAIVYPNVPGCYKIKILGNGSSSVQILFTEAVRLCYSIGGDGLMTMPDGNAMNEFYSHFPAVLKTAMRFLFIGLFRTDLSQPFGWMLPELKIADYDIPWSGADISECGAGILYYYTSGSVAMNVIGIKYDQAGIVNGYICHFSS